MSPDGEWASDTGDPILDYYLSPFTEPDLKIARAAAPGTVELAWDAGATGMQLQRASQLVNPDWQLVPGAEMTNRVFLATENSSEFFRLVEA